MNSTIISETEARFRADPSAAKSTPTVYLALLKPNAIVLTAAREAAAA